MAFWWTVPRSVTSLSAVCARDAIALKCCIALNFGPLALLLQSACKSPHFFVGLEYLATLLLE